MCHLVAYLLFIENLPNNNYNFTYKIFFIDLNLLLNKKNNNYIIHIFIKLIICNVPIVHNNFQRHLINQIVMSGNISAAE